MLKPRPHQATGRPKTATIVLENGDNNALHCRVADFGDYSRRRLYNVKYTIAVFSRQCGLDRVLGG